MTARARSFLTILFAIALTSHVAADVDLRSGCRAHFSSAVEAKEVLGQKDDFIQRLSPFDRAARMKTDKAVSEEEFLAFVKSNAATWNDNERTKIQTAIGVLRPALERLPISFPEKVSLIKTTGAEEGQAFYTRDTAIMLPEKQLDSANAQSLVKTIAHEIFHILSRAHPELREKLYQVIGFTNCGEIDFPSELKPRKITNPDAPRNNHAIRLRVGEREVHAVPILFSNVANYDMSRGGEFFNYLQFNFLILSNEAVTRPELSAPDQVSGFFEQVGRNTNYVIHPEEILAENFALLMLGERNVPSPDVLAKMRRVLEQK